MFSFHSELSNGVFSTVAAKKCGACCHSLDGDIATLNLMWMLPKFEFVLCYGTLRYRVDLLVMVH